MLYGRAVSTRIARAQAWRNFQRNHLTQRNLLTLAIETSCDDTAVAILEKDSPLDPISVRKHAQRTGSDETARAAPVRNNGRGPPLVRLLFNKKITSRNTGLGGIHPLEALESHQSNLGSLVAQAIEYLPTLSADSIVATRGQEPKSIRQADGKLKQIPDFISVTRGPGMRSNLNCGLDTAKGLATAWQVPLLGVHHMQAHALTPRLVYALEHNGLDDTRPGFPFLTLLVSGGHTMLLNSSGLVDHQILATTRDVAIGDALDKCGRIILPENVRSQAKDTAFARYLSDYAFPDVQIFQQWPIPARRHEEIDKPHNEYGWRIKAPLSDTKDLAFSFTSIASEIEKLFSRRQEQEGTSLTEKERTTFAQTALGIAFEHLASRTLIALEKLRDAHQEPSTLVVSGGVAANSFLRYFLRNMLDVRGFEKLELLFPPVWLCTDNAVMIAWCGMEMFEAGYQNELDIGSLRKWSMDSTAGGGVLSASGWKRMHSEP